MQCVRYNACLNKPYDCDLLCNEIIDGVFVDVWLDSRKVAIRA